MLYFSAVLTVLIIAVIWNFKSQLEKLKEQHEEELRREITKARKDGKQRSAAVQWGKTIEHFTFYGRVPYPSRRCSILRYAY